MADGSQEPWVILNDYHSQLEPAAWGLDQCSDMSVTLGSCETLGLLCTLSEPGESA